MVPSVESTMILGTLTCTQLWAQLYGVALLVLDAQSDADDQDLEGSNSSLELLVLTHSRFLLQLCTL
jgi:hypothetical protein